MNQFSKVNSSYIFGLSRTTYNGTYQQRKHWIFAQYVNSRLQQMSKPYNQKARETSVLQV